MRTNVRAGLLAGLLALPGLPATALAHLRVITTTTDLKALAEAVGGDRVQVESLTRGYQDPHNVEIRPSYMLKLSRADVFIRTGMDEDLWAIPIAEGARNPKVLPGSPTHVEANRGVDVLEVPTGKVDRSLGDIHVLGNPYYWMDPENLPQVTATILEGLASAAPQDRAVFERNRERFLAELRRLLPMWGKTMEPYRGAKLVTYHATWSYFARRFGLRVVGYLEPKPGVPPTAAHIEELIQTMKAEGVKAIVVEPYYDRRIAERVARDTGAKLLVLPTSVGGARGTETYFDLIAFVTRQLAEAFR